MGSAQYGESKHRGASYEFKYIHHFFNRKEISVIAKNKTCFAHFKKLISILKRPISHVIPEKLDFSHFDLLISVIQKTSFNYYQKQVHSLHKICFGHFFKK